MAGERVHHERLSSLFSHIFNLIERFGAFRKILQRKQDFGLDSLVKKRDGRENALYCFNNLILHKSLQLVIALDAFVQPVHLGSHELLHVRVTCLNLIRRRSVLHCKSRSLARS